VPALDVDASVPSEQQPELHQHRKRTARRRRHRGANHAELWEGPKPEDEQRIERQVDGVRQPQHAHGNRGIARAAKDRVLQEEQHDAGISAEHHHREPRVVTEQRRLGAHKREQPARVEPAGESDDRRDDDAEREHLHGRHGGAVAILLANPPRHRRRRANAQRHRNGIHDGQHRLGETNSRHRVRAKLRDEEDVDDHEQRLHAHLEHHRNREQEHGRPHRALRVVARRSTHRFFHKLPTHNETSPPCTWGPRVIGPHDRAQERLEQDRRCRSFELQRACAQGARNACSGAKERDS
jgi:hypothetical protein